MNDPLLHWIVSLLSQIEIKKNLYSFVTLYPKLVLFFKHIKMKFGFNVLLFCTKILTISSFNKILFAKILLYTSRRPHPS